MKKKLVSFAIALVMALLFSLPVMAEGSEETGEAVSSEQSGIEMNYVRDFNDLLTYDQWEELEQSASDISQSHGCGVYIVTLEDYKDYGSGDVFEVTTQIYHDEENHFGVGEGRDGIMLLLSVQNRDWAMFVYGDQAEYAFNSYGQEMLEDVFLDNLGKDDWYGGFSDYREACEEYLVKADAGEPVRKSPKGYIMLSVVISALIALIVCQVLKGRMNTVHQKTEANSYVAGGVKLSESYDRYTYTTETQHKIEKESQKESGGGGSGRSGKF